MLRWDMVVCSFLYFPFIHSYERRQLLGSRSDGIVCCLLFPIPLHAARRAMAAASAAALADSSSNHFSTFNQSPCPQPRNIVGFYRGSLITFSPCPPNTQERKRRRKQKQIKHRLISPPGLLLLHALRTGFDLLLGPRLAHLSLPLGDCGLVFGHLWGHGPSLPAWRGWLPPSPGGQAGLPLASTGIRPRPMGPRNSRT